MMNVCNFMGRLVRDPEMRRTGSGIAVVSFTIAVDRDFSGDSGERKADFVDLVAWRQTGEFVARNFQKGSPIAVVARYEPRHWKDKDGGSHVSAEFNVSNVYFCGSKKPDNNGGNNAASGYGAPANNGYAAPAAGNGGYTAPAGNGYGAPANNGYSAPAPNGGYTAPASNGYAAPAPAYGGYAAPAAPDFQMLNEDDAQLPF